MGYYEPALYQNYFPGPFAGFEASKISEPNSFLPSDCSDCVFISGLPKSIQKEDLISMFSQVGKIKVAKGELSILFGIIQYKTLMSNLFLRPRFISFTSLIFHTINHASSKNIQIKTTDLSSTVVDIVRFNWDSGSARY